MTVDLSKFAVRINGRMVFAPTNPRAIVDLNDTAETRRAILFYLGGLEK